MIGLRITSAERVEYEAAAADKAMSISQWIRHCCALVLRRRK